MTDDFNSEKPANESLDLAAKIQRGEIPDERERNLMNGNVESITNRLNFQALDYVGVTDYLRKSVNITKNSSSVAGWKKTKISGMLFLLKKEISVPDSSLSGVFETFLLQSLSTALTMFGAIDSSSEFINLKVQSNDFISRIKSEKTDVKELYEKMSKINSSYEILKTKFSNMEKVA